MQELNVQELSLATEDSQYGVRLQGEPDNERLGKRLKGNFKKVMEEGREEEFARKLLQKQTVSAVLFDGNIISVHMSKGIEVVY